MVLGGDHQAELPGGLFFSRISTQRFIKECEEDVLIIDGDAVILGERGA